MLLETTNFKVSNKILCNNSSILVLFKKVIFKWMGVPDFWEGQMKNRAKCKKMIIFQARNFSRLSLTHQNSLFYIFSDQIHPP